MLQPLSCARTSYFCNGVVQRLMATSARSTSSCKPPLLCGSKPSKWRSLRTAVSVASPLHDTN